MVQRQIEGGFTENGKKEKTGAQVAFSIFFPYKKKVLPPRNFHKLTSQERDQCWVHVSCTFFSFQPPLELFPIFSLYTCIRREGETRERERKTLEFHLRKRGEPEQRVAAPFFFSLFNQQCFGPDTHTYTHGRRSAFLNIL